MMDMNVIWDTFLERMKEQISTLSYDTWFKETKLVSLKDGIATIIVPMNLHKKHLSENYSNIIDEIFKSVTETNWTFSYLLEDEFDSNTIIEDIDIGIPYNSSIDANLNPKCTFESFIIGDSNKFAWTAALSVAEKPGKAYNPLFIYGKSGVGKTHLMQAIGNYIVNNSNLKVLYISSEKFVNDFISIVRNKNSDNFNSINEFKNKYRNVDVLIIDDIQFLEGATATQQEFFHTFNDLYNSNKQIIIASDRSINDLKLLEDRLKTRFSCGLTANITPPDLELRLNIIKNKIKFQDSLTDIPEDVIQYIANNFDSDVRSLEGAITRVFAYSLMMNNGVVTLENAVEALKDQINAPCNFKNDIHRIQRAVSDYFHINIDDLKGKKRSKTIVFPRQIAVYLCRNLTTESFPKIGSYFGGRDHSTIMHSCEKISDDIKSNDQIKNIIKDLKKILTV